MLFTTVDSPEFLTSLCSVNNEPIGSLTPLDLLQRLRTIQQTPGQAVHHLDPWFMGLYEEIFIKPNRLVHTDLYRRANRFPLPEPCSTEHISVWRTNMDQLGLGYRIPSGFYALIRPATVTAIVAAWPQSQGTLYDFLHLHLTTFLPWQCSDGDVATPIAATFLHLARAGYLELTCCPDLPSPAYFQHQFNWIVKKQ
ncbi:hypothetical protein [Heliophilum fasciatum]|uniref:Uncharacterized protein n=1 Tax=Heliophilum fasciatum TaxID=35700 RepID=A0A4R2RMK7_9FIRM|nr:hypothetical protein [Heliophilum fasciatum]MCW2277987.1 hypothetical protein [Heliophilum fasciatum]TCP64393.1 hypothetical protein EDD73_11092 [Heliophilum fasciatum]